MSNAFLIYLDHSTIVTLERTLKRDSHRFDSFVERWHANGCILALTFVHVLEVSGSRYADSREARIRVLERLGPARTDLITNLSAPSPLRQLTGREIFSTLGHLVGRGDLLATTDRHWVAFPTTLPQSTIGPILRKLLSAHMRRVYDRFQEPVKLEAKALTRPLNTKFVQYRLRDLPSGPIPAAQADEAWEIVRSTLASKEFREDIVASFPPELRQGAFQSVGTWMDTTFERMISAGPREVFAESVGADLQTALKQFTHRLTVSHIFRQSVEEIIHEVLKSTDPVVTDRLAGSVKLEDCPGAWLRYEVDHELRRARSKWEPGATYDLLHLSHLPYVDLMFTDAEIAENTRKVLRRDNMPASLALLEPPIHVGASVEDIESAISIFAGPTK